MTRAAGARYSPIFTVGGGNGADVGDGDGVASGVGVACGVGRWGDCWAKEDRECQPNIDVSRVRSSVINCIERTIDLFYGKDFQILPGVPESFEKVVWNKGSLAEWSRRAVVAGFNHPKFIHALLQIAHVTVCSQKNLQVRKGACPRLFEIGVQRDTTKGSKRSCQS